MEIKKIRNKPCLTTCSGDLQNNFKDCMNLKVLSKTAPPKKAPTFLQFCVFFLF